MDFDIRNNDWICSTPVGDEEMKNLFVTYMESIGIPICSIYRGSYEFRSKEGYFIFINIGKGRALDGTDNLEADRWKNFPRFTYKQLIKMVEEIREQETTKID